MSTLAPVAMTNSFGLVNLLNIIAFCSFDKSIMSWFTYALGKIFIGTFYTKLSLVYTNKACGGGLKLMGASQDLKDAKLSRMSKLTRSQEDEPRSVNHGPTLTYWAVSFSYTLILLIGTMKTVV